MKSATNDNSAVTISVEGKNFNVTLYDNATTRDLVSLLPLTLTLSDFGGQEKTGRLPRALSTSGAPSSSNASAGEIGYYAPDRVIVLFYKDIGSFSGVVRLGKINVDKDAIRNLPNNATATIKAVLQ